MKLIKQLTVVGILIFTAVSCKTVVKSTSSDVDYMKITKGGIVQAPLVADMQVVPEKFTLTKTYDDKTYAGITLNKAKELIMGDFVKEAKCDLVVQPYFVITTTTVNSSSSTINITLKGYPATYTNIKNAEKSDLTIIRKVALSSAGSTEKEIFTEATTDNKGHKGNLFWRIIGYILLVGLLF